MPVPCSIVFVCPFLLFTFLLFYFLFIFFLFFNLFFIYYFFLLLLFFFLFLFIFFFFCNCAVVSCVIVFLSVFSFSFGALERLYSLQLRSTSRKRTYIILTHFYIVNGVYRGIHYFSYFFSKT